MLPNLVHEVRQERAGAGTPRISPINRREQEHQARTNRALQRAAVKEANS